MPTQNFESYVFIRFPIVGSNFDGATLANPAFRPYNLLIERNYIHGRNGQFANLGIGISARDVLIQDNWIDNLHSSYREANAFYTNSAQHFKLINNMLESCGENTMSGAGGPDTPGQILAFGTYQFNYFRKRHSWNNNDGGKGGEACIEKNLFEFKIGQDMLIDSNVLENSPAGGQGGNVFQLSPTSDQPLGGPFNTIQRVTISNNIIMHAVSGGEAIGQDSTGSLNHYSPQSELITVNHITYRNNFFFDLSKTKWGNGVNAIVQCFVLGGNPYHSKVPGPDDLVLDHNTCIFDEFPGNVPGGQYYLNAWHTGPSTNPTGLGYYWGEYQSNARITNNYFPMVPGSDGSCCGYDRPAAPYLPSQKTWESPAAVVDNNCWAQTLPHSVAKVMTSNSSNSIVSAPCPASVGAPKSVLDYEFAIKSGNEQRCRRSRNNHRFTASATASTIKP